jgi:hypothetical protein
MRSPSKSAPVVIKILGYAYNIFVLQSRLHIRDPHALAAEIGLAGQVGKISCLASLSSAIANYYSTKTC